MSRLTRINREIARATRKYDFRDEQAYVYCDAAAEYANAKNDFIRLHVEACNHRGTWQRRREFSLDYDKLVERMRNMHKELIRTKDQNQNLIRETDERYHTSFDELDRFEVPKFVALFKEYAALNEDTPFNINAASAAIKQHAAQRTRDGYAVTPMWIAPHMFKMFVDCAPLSVKLKTHAAFQAMINAKVPNATVAWRGGETELRLWDSGYVFYGSNCVLRQQGGGLTTAICSLSLDASGQALALEAPDTTTLLFRLCHPAARQD